MKTFAELHPKTATEFDPMKRKLNANQRALLAAYVNAVLTRLDGFSPRRLRLDYETMTVVQLVPLDKTNDASQLKAIDFVTPMLRELRRSNKSKPTF